MRLTERLPPDEWARRHRIYDETTGWPGPREPGLTPYVIPFGRAVWEGAYRRFVLVTAAQSGKTDEVLDLIGARLDQRPAPIIYAGPTRDFLTDQFEPRLMALLDQARTLAEKVARGRVMKKTLKRVAGVRVRLAHAGSSAALKSDPAALAFVDEYDEMTRNVKGQGDVLGLIEARGETYADFVTVITSTPSTGLTETETDPLSGLEFWKVSDPDTIESPIWRLFQQGTRFHFAWPCAHCGEFFIPRLSLLCWPEGASPAEAGRAAHIACPHCGGVLTDAEHKARMNAGGVLIAPGQRIEDGKVVGDPPATGTFSMWVSGLCSPFVTWGARAERFLDALQSGDPDQVQTAVNAGFGELYAPGLGGDVPDWQEVKAKALPYRTGEAPREVLRVVAGIDVQKHGLYFVIRGFGWRGSSWLLDWGQLHGPTDEEGVWSDLTTLLLTPIAGLQIEKAFIDSGFRPNKPESGDEHKVYEYCRRMGWLAWPTKGHDTLAQPYRVAKIEVTPKGKKATYSINLVHLSTDFFKSLVMSAVRTPTGAAGSFHVPEDVTEDFCRQIVSEYRTVNEKGRPEWVLRARANHFLDCEALAAAAAYSLNVQRIPEGVVRSIDADRREPPVASGESAPSEERQEEALPQPVPPHPAGGAPTRNRFAGMSARINR